MKPSPYATRTRILTLVTLASAGLIPSVASADTVNAIYNSAADVPVAASSYTATGNTVDFTLNFAPSTGTDLMVVNNTGLDFIHGTFDNLTNGQAVTLSYAGTVYSFVANYYGGSGNDLVLTWARSVWLPGVLTNSASSATMRAGQTAWPPWRFIQPGCLPARRWWHWRRVRPIVWPFARTARSLPGAERLGPTGEQHHERQPCSRGSGYHVGRLRAVWQDSGGPRGRLPTALRCARTAPWPPGATTLTASSGTTRPTAPSAGGCEHGFGRLGA